MGSKPGYGVNQRQPRSHSSVGIVLVRLRIPEVYKHAIAHISRHKAAKPRDRLGYGFLVGGKDLAQVLRVHALGECGRSDQVAEHDRYLASLSGILSSQLGRGCWFGTRDRAELHDRTQHLSTITKQYTQFF